MRRKHLLLSSCFGLALAVLASGTIFVKQTAAAYSGACTPLTGVPKILQQAGFIPVGKCSVDKECKEAVCEVDGKPGICTKTVVDKKNVCICKPRRISR